MHISDTKAAHPVLHKAYLVNVLINSKSSTGTFYKIDLLLEYQNVEFKRFSLDYNFFLYGSNEMFWLQALLVDILRKIRFLMNWIIISQERNSYHS